MKKTYTFATRSIVAATVSLACALPAMAQNSPATDTAANTNTGATTTVQTTQRETHDRDYGWIGLLGLAGLLGLRRKKEDHHRTDVHRTTTATNAR